MNSREAQALLALARQLTPPADERERLAGFTVNPSQLRRVGIYRRPGRACRQRRRDPWRRQRDHGTPPGTGTTGGAGVAPAPAPISTPAEPTVSGAFAKIIDGVAYAPSDAPIQVQEAIWAGNKIRRKPYIWGGGHQGFSSKGYDCSGSVSFVLHAAGLLRTPMASTDFFNWGKRGLGQWITVYTNTGHAFVEIAGIRLDTSAEGEGRPLAGTASGQRSSLAPAAEGHSGFQPRHLLGDSARRSSR